MRVEEVLKAYNALKDLKMTDVSESEMIKIWKNIKAFRPVVETYNKDVEDVNKSLQDKEFEEMQIKAQKLRDLEGKRVKGEYTFSSDDYKDVETVNKYFADFNKKSEGYFKKLNEVDVEITVEKLTEEEMLKCFKTNGKSFKDMEEISSLF